MQIKLITFGDLKRTLRQLYGRALLQITVGLRISNLRTRRRINFKKLSDLEGCLDLSEATTEAGKTTSSFGLLWITISFIRNQYRPSSATIDFLIGRSESSGHVYYPECRCQWM